jgi:hypothetical protein
MTQNFPHRRKTAGDLTGAEFDRCEQVGYRLILAMIDWDIRGDHEDGAGSDWHLARHEIHEIHDEAQLDCVLETMAIFILPLIRGERQIEWDPEHEEPPAVYNDAVRDLTARIASLRNMRGNR